MGWLPLVAVHAAASYASRARCHFLITGYPRSGTAWLANLFTWGPSLCVHDPREIVDRGEGDPFDPAWAPAGVKHLGYADSGWAVYQAAHPALDSIPLAIVWRSRAEARQSFAAFAARMGFPAQDANAGFNRCADALEEFHRQVRGMQRVAYLDYASLDDPVAVGRLWSHLLPGVPFPERRFELLKRMRITSDLERRGLWAG
jgi:hypothetical protein